MAAAALAAGALALAALLVAARSGADEDENEAPASAPPRVSVVNGETVVTLEAGALAKSGIQVAPLQALRHRADAAAYGVVLDVTELADARGALVAAGARVERARAAAAASRSELERVRTLRADASSASQKALEEATARWTADDAEARGADAALGALTASARLRWGPVAAGWAERGGAELDALLAQETRLVQVTLPPGAEPAAAPATAAVRAAGGPTVAARLVSVAPRTDPRIQGTSFYYETPAAAGLLPGAAVEAFLPAGAEAAGVLVPAASVVWWQGRAWVYLETGPGRFVRRAVATDAPVPGGWFVAGGERSGVAPGGRVVVRGAQTLLSEEGRGAVRGSEG